MGVMYSLEAAIDILGIIDPWAASMGARAVMRVVDMVGVCCGINYQYRIVVDFSSVGTRNRKVECINIKCVK
jgi:hypothetical protein